MMRIPLFVLCFLLVTFTAHAQTTGAQKCFRLVNDTGENVMGMIATAPDVSLPPQRMNFTLTPDGDTKVLKVCSSGPFFEGERLRLVLRTVVPVFECKTNVSGDVIVERVPTSTGDGTKLSARCR